jgi:predicted nuclease of restriction endonuclease-like (RecB) superfamily
MQNASAMNTKIRGSKEYKELLREVKSKIHSSQIKAAVTVNQELLGLYWNLGKMITDKQKKTLWGEGLILQLSKDLSREFPDMKGFSERNLFYIQKWYLFFSPNYKLLPQVVAVIEKSVKLPQLVAVIENTNTRSKIRELITRIPWGHNREIITRCKDLPEALFYVTESLRNNWSRNVLVLQIESNLFRRKGKAVTNFKLTLPKPQSDLAEETLKNSYNFDFLTLSPETQELQLEKTLTDHIMKFLLELGAGFAFVGRQYHLAVEEDDFYVDLLFYHTKLHCYVVVELKTGKFMPEHAGKLNFYLSVLDDKLKTPDDHPSVGILICKQRNKIVAEYALKDMNKPIGITEYKLTEIIPKKLKGNLPSIEELEEELGRETKKGNDKKARI